MWALLSLSHTVTERAFRFARRRACEDYFCLPLSLTHSRIHPYKESSNQADRVVERRSRRSLRTQNHTTTKKEQRHTVVAARHPPIRCDTLHLSLYIETPWYTHLRTDSFRYKSKTPFALCLCAGEGLCDTESGSTTKHTKKGKQEQQTEIKIQKGRRKTEKKRARSRAEKRQATRRSCVFSCGSTIIAKGKLTSRCTFQIGVLFPLPPFCKPFASFGLKLVSHARCEFARLRSVRGCAHWCASISCSAVLVLACIYIFFCFESLSLSSFLFR